MSFVEWPADEIEPGRPVVIWGFLCFVALDGLQVAGRRIYVELMQEQWTPTETRWLRWPAFCNAKQLGLPDAQRRAVLRGKRRGEGRMVITALELEQAKERGSGPQRPYVTLAKPALTLLACTVMDGPRGSVLEGHRCLSARPQFKPGPVTPLPAEVIADGQRSLAFEHSLEDRS